MYYRFENGTFIEAETFDEAKKVLIEKISSEEERTDSWHKCTCLGFSHRRDCPENPVNMGEIPF